MKVRKRLITMTGLSLVALLLCAPLAASGGRGCGYGGGGEGQFSCTNTFSQLPKEALSSEEQASLIKMREEEKLARDVYQTLSAQWGVKIFTHISSSEQRHMATIKALLDKYGISDPVQDDRPGVFQDNELQELYQDLVKQGSLSLKDALAVGAMIEDLDIKDLEDALKVVDNRDIALAYQNLSKGSRNHLRSFVRWLNNQSQDYEARFLSQEEIEKILATPHERGRVDETGLLAGGCGNGRRSGGRMASCRYQ